MKRRPPRRTPAANVVPLEWAVQAVFQRAKIVAWEGTAVPITATRVYPSNIAFLQGVMGGARDSIWGDCIHPVDRVRVNKFFSTLGDVTLPATIDYRMVDSQGAAVWVRHSIEDVTLQGATARLRGFVSDIQSEKEYQLESLRVSEREQNRIGQDLHDDLCQVLAGVSCLMRVFELRIAAKCPDEVPALKELNEQIVDAMHRTRALTHGLFPGKIQVADIRGAILELASQVKARFKVEISTQFAGRFQKHSASQIIQIYRICQEAMSNAIKHGQATRIEVRLEAQNHAMELTVSDNGSGFPKTENTTPGVGLNIMKYRAALLGGEFSVSNGSEQGAVVRLRYPFEGN